MNNLARVGNAKNQGSWHVLIGTIVTAGLFAIAVDPSKATPLDDAMVWWRAHAFHCTDGGLDFPSKERKPTAGDTSACEDGDMTLFNGLLCAAGESIGCKAVRDSQTANDGRWWRSPRRANLRLEYPQADVSFSPDQLLGVLLYAITTQDAVRFAGYLKFLDTDRPCVVTNPINGSCILQGWPRLCNDDSVDHRCTFRPGTCDEIERVGNRLGAAGGDLCRRVLSQFQIQVNNVRDFLYPTELLAAGAVVVNEQDFPLHLAAVKIFLLIQMQDTSPYIKASGDILAVRDPSNPFFLYLSEGPSPNVLNRVLQGCPSQANPAGRYDQQWTWERPIPPAPWIKSMYWDCIFMGRLLGQNRNRGRGLGRLISDCPPAAPRGTTSPDLREGPSE